MAIAAPILPAIAPKTLIGGIILSPHSNVLFITIKNYLTKLSITYIPSGYFSVIGIL
jgi:hypothetical protein